MYKLQKASRPMLLWALCQSGGIAVPETFSYLFVLCHSAEGSRVGATSFSFPWQPVLFAFSLSW